MGLLSLRLEGVLADMEVFAAENDARGTERRLRMLSVERASAELLHLLVRTSGRRRVLETGTSHGYSAVWLAAALEATGGTLVTVERDPANARLARSNLERAGVSRLVTIVEADATEAVESMETTFDAGFLGADRVSAPAQLRSLLPRLAPDVLLVCDNVTSQPAEARAYLDLVQGIPGFVGSAIALGKGLHVAHRGRPPPGAREVS